MADSTITNLTAVSTPADTDEIPCQQSGDSSAKKITRAQIRSGLSATGHTHTLADVTDAGTAAAAATGDFAAAAHTHDASEVTLAKIGSPAYSTLQHMQNVIHSTGWVAGGVVTSDGAGAVNVTSGSGLIRATDSNIAEIKFFDWSAANGVALDNNAKSYVYVDYNAGAPTVVASTTDPEYDNTTILLAEVYREGTTLHIFDATRQTIGDHAALMMRAMSETMPFAWVSGASLTATGTRNIAVSAGVFWHGLSRIETPAIDTSGAGTFTAYYRDNAGGWTKQTAQTQINNTQYDDGDGTLGTLTSTARYGVHWVYLSDSGELSVQFGQGDYTISQANNASVPSPPPMVSVDSRLIGKIIIQKSAASFTSIESSFAADFAFANTNIDGANITTGTVAAARLGTMTGDAGAGGASGAAPAPGAGDAAAGKFLKADATWAAPEGGASEVFPAPASPSAYDDEFDSLSGSWTLGANVSAGTVNHLGQQSSATVVDAATVPGSILLQGHHPSTSTRRELYKTISLTTNCIVAVGAWVEARHATTLAAGSWNAAANANQDEGYLEFRIRNSSSPSNDFVSFALYPNLSVGLEAVFQSSVVNGGTFNVSHTLIPKAELAEGVMLAAFKIGNEYHFRAFMGGPKSVYLGYQTKTGTTTLDEIAIVLLSKSANPSPVCGVEFLRVFENTTSMAALFAG